MTRLILVYGCCLAVCIPFLWFLPETKGKSLEEVGLIFGDRHIHVALKDSASPEESLGAHEKQADERVTPVSEHLEG